MAPAKPSPNEALAARRAEQERIQKERLAAQEAKRAEQAAAIEARKQAQEKMREQQLAARQGSVTKEPAPTSDAPPSDARQASYSQRLQSLGGSLRGGPPPYKGIGKLN